MDQLNFLYLHGGPHGEQKRGQLWPPHPRVNSMSTRVEHGLPHPYTDVRHGLEDRRLLRISAVVLSSGHDGRQFAFHEQGGASVTLRNYGVV